MRTFLRIVSVCLVTATIVTVGGAWAEEDPATLTNAERKVRNIPALASTPDLVSFAQRRAEEMARAQRLWHAQRLGDQVGNWQRVGENVGRGPYVSDIHREFMASPSHRDNIIDAGFTQLGVGVARGSDGLVYVAVIFRLPENQAAPASPPPAQPKPKAARPAPPPAPAAPAPPPVPAPAPVPAPVAEASVPVLQAAPDAAPPVEAPPVVETPPAAPADPVAPTPPPAAEPPAPETLLAYDGIFAPLPATRSPSDDPGRPAPTPLFALAGGGFLALCALAHQAMRERLEPAA